MIDFIGVGYKRNGGVQGGENDPTKFQVKIFFFNLKKKNII